MKMGKGFVGRNEDKVLSFPKQQALQIFLFSQRSAAGNSSSLQLLNASTPQLQEAIGFFEVE